MTINIGIARTQYLAVIDSADLTSFGFMCWRYYRPKFKTEFVCRVDWSREKSIIFNNLKINM